MVFFLTSSSLSILSIFVDKFHYYGGRGVTLNWFESYQTNRTEQTVVNGGISDKSEFTYRVPQGSILGPLLFYLHQRSRLSNLPFGNSQLC